MKVLTINCVNNVYSTGKIIRSIEKCAVDKEIDFRHCYEFGDAPSSNNEYRITGDFLYRILYVISLVTGNRYGGGIISTNRLCREIKRYAPDIVHIHCPNARSINLFKLISFLNKLQVHTVITNHAEFFYTGNCAHSFECDGYMYGCKNCENLSNAETHFKCQARTSWNKMYDAIQNNDKLTMTVVSPWAKKRAEKSPIFKNKDIRVIGNGIDESIFKCREYWAKEHKTVLHVTSHFSDREDDPKGGRYILELAKRMPEIEFIVAGNIGTITSELPNNLTLKGEIKDSIELAELYSKADLLVMTSKRETFGLTCIEAMCCGTPVVGFLNGGTESIAIEQYSEFVEYNHLDELIGIVKKWIVKKASVTEELTQKAQVLYSEKRMGQEFIKLYYEILNRGK